MAIIAAKLCTTKIKQYAGMSLLITDESTVLYMRRQLTQNSMPNKINLWLS